MGASAKREVGCRQVIDLGSWRKFDKVIAENGKVSLSEKSNRISRQPGGLFEIADYDGVVCSNL